MDVPLLATKLHAPMRRARSVRRERLTERLDRPGRVILIAAPAGFGKTSILTEWLEAGEAGSPTAWVSLDERDDDAPRFWRYVLTAVDRAIPGAGTAALELAAAAPSDHDAMIATLVNDLDARGARLAVVLDDLHVIENPAIHAALAALIDALPAGVRLVIASRADPPLPLGRLRASGELVELRAADLRFSEAETAGYLNDSMGLALPSDEVSALGARTEGWIAALQLAAISMQGRPDASAFIAGFAGDDRYVVDYLVEEVLQRQTDATRSFLLRTSILERLSAELCDAVTAETGSGAMLDGLDRANLFLVPLDDTREWFRYHHLFAEMLRTRLLDEHLELVPDLHLRASRWFAANGHPGEAIGHALGAGAFGEAAELIRAAMPAMQQQRQEVTVAGWLDLLPRDVVRADPELGIGYAGVLLSAGRTDGVDRLLADAEDAIGESSDGIDAIRRGVALYRAARALDDRDLSTAETHSATAVALSEDGSHIDRGSAHGLRGLVLWAGGDVESARASWEISLDELRRAGHLADTLGGSIAMGDILIAQGHLRDAEARYRAAIDLATSESPPLRGAADMHVGLADVLRERGDFAAAERQLDAAVALGEHAGLPQNRHRRRVAAARLLLSQGRAGDGIRLLDEAEVLYTPDFFPEVQPIPALRARFDLAVGARPAALDWARRRGIRPDDKLTYLTEFEHVTLARIMIDTGEMEAAARLLDRLLSAADAAGREGVALELLVLQARASGRPQPLVRAVRIAEREGHARVFADEGPVIARLLGMLETPHARHLAGQSGRGATARLGQSLPDPLSERELEVLRLLASDLSGPEIARRLVVSLNTLRTHTKNIYAKLGATSRREAVRFAGERGLISPR